MHKKLLLSIAMLVVGAGLLVAVGFASPASSGNAKHSAKAANGGTLRIDSRSDFDFTDPALAYFSHSWAMEYTTCAKLINFQDKEAPQGSQIYPEIAQGFPAISKDGKTYSFTVRKGYKFSTGQDITAANFAFVINRDLNPKMQSPASTFIEDIVGAKDVLDGKAATASGVKVAGNKLVITLTQPAPDFVARISMPFFCPLPLDTPIDPNGIQAPVPASGPYMLKEHTAKRTALVVRNPNYKGPRIGRVDALSYTFGNSLAATLLRVKNGDTDIGGFPPSASAELAATYGINKGRFFIRQRLVVWYLNLNHDNGRLFQNNVPLAQAVNFAIDRPQITRQFGYLAGRRTDQFLPFGMPGYKDWDIYPLKGSNYAKAKSLANGHTKGGTAVLYTFDTAPGPQIAQVVQFNLGQIGLKVDVKTFERTTETDKGGTRGEPFDILVNGWGADYPDPFDFLNVLISGKSIQATNNVNLSYFSDPVFNKRLDAASKLSGAARYKAYGILDRDLAKAGSEATFVQSNGQAFVSDRVAHWQFQPAYGVTNYVATSLKG